MTPKVGKVERVTGVGGVFFRAKDPAGLAAWYRDHLGFELEPEADAVAVFRWTEHGTTTWSAFPPDTQYFGHAESSAMINYRVGNLDRMLVSLAMPACR